MEENPKSPDGQAGSGSEPKQEPSNDVANLQSKLAFLEKESKEAFKVRDELKQKLKAIEDAEEAKKGNYEKLLNERNAELEQLKAEAEELKKTKETFESFQSKMKDELLAELPDGHKAIAVKLSLEDLKEYVSLHKSGTPGMNTARTGGRVTEFDSLDSLDGLSLAEMDLMKKNNPAKYKVLFAKKYPLTKQ